jgi:acetyl esterase
MPLEPHVSKLVEGLAAMPTTDLETMTPAQLRQNFKAMQVVGDAPAIPRTAAAVPGPAGDIPVWVYDPDGSSPGPTVVWYHGGGWVIGDLETADGTCRRLAAASGMRVVSVDYRLAPEAPYPAAVEDAHAAFAAVAGGALGGPPPWVAVGGDSAGGNLAAVECLVARDRGTRMPDFQLLVYPVTDQAMDTESYRDNGEGYMLTAASMRWLWDHYQAPADDPYASPLRAGSLEGLPPAYVVTAEFDPLRDEGEAYAARIRDAGGVVEAVRYDGQVHGFFGTPEMYGPTAQLAVEVAGAALRAAAAVAA